MEAAILEKIVLGIIGLVVSGLGTWFGLQIKKYRKLTKEEEDRTIKNTISNTLNEGLSPIQTDISNMKKDIGNMKNDIANLQNFETNFQTRLQPTQEEIEHLKDDITEILSDLRQKGIEINNIGKKEELLAHETRCAWRYRIRQLCHVYIARGYMSFEEYSQLQEMYNIYAAIGGNGQTKELYDKVISTVEIKTDAEIVEIKNVIAGK